MELTPRQRRVLEIVAKAGEEETAVSQLARELNVSAVTMRREVDALAVAGKLRRVHGAVLLVREDVVLFRFAGREDATLGRKRAIGFAAAQMVEPGMLIGLDTGTTTLEVARAMVNRLEALSAQKSRRRKVVRVVTNSLPAAAILQPSEHVEVILAGGVLRRSDPDVTGPLAADVLGRFQTDLAFLGCDTLNRDGAFVEDVTVINTAMALLQNTRAGVLVADSSKWGSRGRIRYARLSEFQRLITDDRLQRRHELVKLGCDLIVAEAKGTSHE